MNYRKEIRGGRRWRYRDKEDRLNDPRFDEIKIVGLREVTTCEFDLWRCRSCDKANVEEQIPFWLVFIISVYFFVLDIILGSIFKAFFIVFKGKLGIP